VDRDKLFADAIGAVMDRRGAYEIVSAGSSQDAIRLAAELQPAIALISLDLADIAAADGVSIVARIRAEASATLVLGMVHAHDRTVTARATELGLQGVLTADDSVASFMRSIEEALRRGGVDVGQPKARRTARVQEDRSGGPVIGELTTREFEVLELLVQSRNGREIAERLGISRNTVRSHMQSIFHKLHVHSRLEAAAFAVKNGISEPPTASKVTRERSARRKRSA
jgi:DNA-binding NarL/FixJ family response regulator